MSSTDVPVLDKRNLIHFGASSAAGIRFIIDPVAKLWIVMDFWRGRYTDRSSGRFVMMYCPDLNSDMISEQMTEDEWRKLNVIQRDFSIEVVSASVYCDIRSNMFLGVVESDGLFGIGFTGVDPYIKPGRGTWMENDPRYQFCPDDVRIKSKTVGPYFLNFAHLALTESVVQGRKEEIRKGVLTHCGIAIDQKLADHVGLEHFPDLERTEDGLILILSKGLR